MADNIQATPQNRFLGMLSGALQSLHQGLSTPFGYQNPPGEIISGIFGIPGLQRTIERMSYGEPLTTGKGMTTQIRPDTLEAALAVAPVAKIVPRGINLAKEAQAYLPPMKATALPDYWVHGTSKEGAEAILKSGKFDPWAGPRQYSYSQLGSDTSYFTRPEGWWLNPEMTQAGRAATYPSSVGMELSKNANIKIIDSPYQLDSLAKSVGLKNGDDLLKALEAENLDIQFASNKVKNMSFEEYIANELGKRNLTIGQWSEGLGQSIEDSLNNFRKNYDYLRNFVNDADSSKSILNKFKEKGIDGIYISPELEKKQEAIYNLTNKSRMLPASDQLGIFNPNVATPFELRTGLESSIP